MSIYKVPKEFEDKIEATAQRPDITHFMDVTKLAKDAKEGDTVWTQMGDGWTSNTESPSAQTKERKFINERSARSNITSYKPSFAFEVLLMFNKPEVRMVYNIYTRRLTGIDAVVNMVTVDNFDEAKNGYYPARKGKYAVEVSSCDYDDDMIIKGNLNGQGDEAMGWFDPKKGVWSDTEPTAPNSQPESQNVEPAPEVPEDEDE